MEEQESYVIGCRLCKGAGKVPEYIPSGDVDPRALQQGVPPEILQTLMQQGKVQQVEKVCPACGGTGKITAYTSLDELAKTLYKRSGSNLIIGMVGTVLIGMSKTECGACGKEKMTTHSIRISTVMKSGDFEKEQVVTLQLCDKCIEKYKIDENKICRGQQAGPKILIANDGDIKNIAEDNKRLREGDKNATTH